LVSKKTEVLEIKNSVFNWPIPQKETKKEFKKYSDTKKIKHYTPKLLDVLLYICIAGKRYSNNGKI
jgi:hypothetical protein